MPSQEDTVKLTRELDPGDRVLIYRGDYTTSGERRHHRVPWPPVANPVDRLTGLLSRVTPVVAVVLSTEPARPPLAGWIAVETDVTTLSSPASGSWVVVEPVYVLLTGESVGPDGEGQPLLILSSRESAAAMYDAELANHDTEVPPPAVKVVETFVPRYFSHDQQVDFLSRRLDTLSTLPNIVQED